MMNSKLFLAVLAMVCAEEAFSFLLNQYPLHASCKTKWDWPSTACADVVSALEAQIAKWNNTECGSGEKCGYGLTSKTSTQLQAKHVTPVKHYVDDLTFTFKPEGGGSGCQVDGYSTSETWYAVLDYSTNYCNLHNLITGAGLDKVSGYSEQTSDSICTQFSSANCEKY
ncbi:uncharacterized protein [Littorina saxatilis]|uniref:Secreted protein n=1 Tax=Littorina saxatilis TaxID=31220 RepID=A0AAN9BR97_9CAEN